MDFPDWLQMQLDKEGWSQADLAKRSGVTSAQISRVLNGTRAAGPDALNALAQAFRLPAETVFRAAGLLPQIDKDSEDLHVFNEIFSRLEDSDREEVLAIIQAKLDRLQKQKDAKKPGGNSKQIPQS